MSDYDDLEETDDDLDFSFSFDDDEEEEETPEFVAPALEATPPPVVTPPAVEEPEAPKLSFDEMVANAAMGFTPAVAQSAARHPVARYSQDLLARIAATDPDKYAALKAEGHALQRSPWGPDRV